jgi:hypothetical protein
MGTAVRASARAAERRRRGGASSASGGARSAASQKGAREDHVNPPVASTRIQALRASYRLRDTGGAEAALRTSGGRPKELEPRDKVASAPPHSFTALPGVWVTEQPSDNGVYELFAGSEGPKKPPEGGSLTGRTEVRCEARQRVPRPLPHSYYARVGEGLGGRVSGAVPCFLVTQNSWGRGHIPKPFPSACRGWAPRKEAQASL